jgi:hypothetical protein
MSFTLSNNGNAINEAWNHIQAGIITLPGAPHQYLDRAHFNDVTSNVNIQRYINHEPSLAGESAAKKNELFRQVLETPAKRMFVVCIDARLGMTHLRHLISHRFKDRTLPMPSTYTDPMYPTIPAAFRTAEWTLNRFPTFHDGEFTNFMSGGRPNPITLAQAPLGPGTQGTVQRGQIDIQHCTTQFQTAIGGQNTNVTTDLAIKSIDNQGGTAHAEIKFVQFLRLALNNHPQITRFFAGCRSDTTTYLISELANMDLWNLMMDNNGAQQKGLDMIWAKGQLIGLAGALQIIHGPTNGIVAYHHDIKAQNILVFVNNQAHELKFTDWGCAGGETHRAGHPVGGSTNHGGFPCEPPETVPIVVGVRRRTGCPHDIWSLGCVFLQMMLWMFTGKANLTSFMRTIYATSNGPRNCFYGQPPTALAAPVTAALLQLHNLNISMLRNAVAVIRNMLRMDPTTRPTAVQLVQRLNGISSSLWSPAGGLSTGYR